MKQRIAQITYKTLNYLDRDVQDEQKKGQQPRGVAILIALVTIALMSAVVIDVTYNTRVNLAMASNTRDKLKSYYLAKSAVNISSLILSFQFALQNESSDAKQDDMARLINRAIRRSNFQIYQYADLLMQPFNSGRVQTPVGGVDLKETGVEGFGEISGEFNADIVPESGRISLNDFHQEKLKEKYIAPLCAMLVDKQYDPIFELKDDSSELMNRQRIIANIVDYIDPNTEVVRISNECTIEGSGGDENRGYDRAQKSKVQGVRPINAKMTHIEELFQVHGVTQAFMDNFGDQFTVYDVGKPNINVISTPIFYSVLCNNVELENAGRQDVNGFNLCSRDPAIASQVLWLAMALDGLRQFFDDPLSVLLAYVGTKESKLLPSAKKGQPVAFLTLSQLPAFINDFQKNPILMAQFLQYSATYQQLVALNPAAAIDPVTPQFPQWTVRFKRSGLVQDVSTKTPSIYRIKGVGRYGTTETTIETVVDFAKTNRRLPNEKELEAQESDSDDLKNLKAALEETKKQIPRGRVLFWREY